MTTSDSVAVLFSAGLDSAVLAADLAAGGRGVQPIYVAAGLAWEPAELAMAERLLRHPAFARLRPLVSLQFPMRDVYPAGHWAVTGRPPAYDTPDEDVYLIGRNLILLSKAGTWCAQHGIGRLALGPLSGNPFPDATQEFFDAMARALSLGLDHPTEIEAPYRELQKTEVIRRGIQLGVPFELTLSCMNPQPSSGAAPFRPCGACSKCRERHEAFAAAGIADPGTGTGV